jgi:Flp pilus assembly pilin Flp
MKTLLNVSRRFVRDEKAAEITELGIMLALIVALSIPIILSIGQKVLAAYTTTDTALPN